MSGPIPSAADPIIYGLSSTSGIEEKPQIRYESTDKDGVTKWAAVLSRKIHCLAVHASAIKQSIAFPGQIVEVDGVSYGANWKLTNCNVVPMGEAAEIQAEARREGVTPFEWELPPGVSVACADGVSTLSYTPPGGSAIPIAQWDSRTGEDRYGWRVDYVETMRLTYGNSVGSWRSVPIHSCRIYYEGIKQFDADGAASLAGMASRVERLETFASHGPSGNGWVASSEAQAAGEAYLATWIAALRATIATNVDFDTYDPFRFVSGVREIDESRATVAVASQYSVLMVGQPQRYYYKLTVPSIRLEADVDGWVEDFKKGLRWESVIDTDEASATHLHVFYRLRYGGTILFAIDITTATPDP